jgi:hypothetical protein
MTNGPHIQPDHKVAGALSSRILLQDISFVSVRAQMIGAIKSGVLRYDLHKVMVEWSRRENDIIALFPFGLTVEAKGPDKESRPVRVAELSVAIRLDYSLVEANGPVAAEDVPHLIGTLGYMHSWPYFRSDIQYLTTKLGMPALVLPVVLSGEVQERVLISELPISPGEPPIISQKSKKTGRKSTASKSSRDRTD